ncbi:MAG: hypothetical protein ACU837_00685 [Gammaproteobacteria bacterium]
MEELVWENIAEPIYIFVHGLAILQKAEKFIATLDRYVLLALFLALFTQVELLGVLSLQLIGTGQVVAGAAVYAGKFPIAALTFWLFRISKDKLLTFLWFKQAYSSLLAIIERIKSSTIYQRISARLNAIKSWLKMRLSDSKRRIN